MILADTTIWIDHFRAPDAELLKQLAGRIIAMHPFVAGELALGPLRNRRQTLLDFALLPPASEARSSEVLLMIENRKLYSRGIGWADAHLAASCLTTGTLLWTRDVRLGKIAELLNIRALLP